MTRSHRDADVAPEPARPEPWSVKAVDPSKKTPALLWTGEWGIRLARDGAGLGTDGEMLASMVPWHYQTEHEEKIIPIPHPLAFEWQVNGEPIRKDRLEQYRQWLDLKTSILTTEYRAVRGNRHIHVWSESWLANPRKNQRPLLVSRWKIRPSFDAQIALVPVGTNESGTRGMTKFSAEDGTSHFRAEMSWKIGSQTQAVDESVHSALDVPSSQELSVERRVSVSPADQGMNALASDAAPAAWTDSDSDIEIDGPVEDQQAIRAQLWYLRSGYGSASTPPRPSPLLLSGPGYFGHVFWDADVWVGPAMAFLEPEILDWIVRYRLSMVPQAERNAAVAAVQNALKFPWESSVSGRETVPGPSKDQIHITGSVVWGLQRASDLGFVDQSIVSRVGAKAARWFVHRSVPGREGRREIRRVMSPDENHIGDNDLYTNMLAQWLCDRYLPAVGAKFVFPRDQDTFLTYDNDRLRGYKQAAALLAVYPLENPLAVAEAKAMFERFASKATSRGPAMSESIHSIVASRLGMRDEAYGLWRKSWGDFSSTPLLVFAEKRNLANTYFTTGAAGSLQAVLYGFFGLHIEAKRDGSAAASLDLDNGMWLNVRPRLPRAWKRAALRNITILGKKYDLAVDRTSAKFTPVTSSKSE